MFSSAFHDHHSQRQGEKTVFMDWWEFLLKLSKYKYSSHYDKFESILFYLEAHRNLSIDVEFIGEGRWSQGAANDGKISDTFELIAIKW